MEIDKVRVSPGMFETKLIVAPNSPNARANASANPATNPRSDSGKVMPRKMRHGPAPRVAAENKPAAEPKQASATAKRKLSFKEKHALETLPQRIEELQAESAKLNKAIAGDLYTRDPALFAKATARLDAVAKDIAEAEERWLELEMLREEIGA